MTLSDSEQMFVLEGLQALLTVKRDALKVVTAEADAGRWPHPRFTEHDFGIPQIQALIARLGTEFYGETDDERR